MHNKELISPQERKSSSGSWDMVDRKKEITPPGTPPPPYLQSSTCSIDSRLQELADVEKPNLSMAMQINSPNTTILAAQTNLVQKSIISMEDDENSDQEGFIEEHGPFRSFSKLLEPEHTAHLSVFLNFVLSNSDPAPVLFYLITSLYKEGTVKDMRKWAYEIHSTFLVPSAPLLWSNVDESLAREIDSVLQNEFDKGEILRKIFWKSRGKAKDIINTQLQEYQVKRTAGLGTMYGPSDQVLSESKGDKNREQKIVEETLIPKLQQYL
jgi:Rho guanine nucleotide exchange factor 12